MIRRVADILACVQGIGVVRNTDICVVSWIFDNLTSGLQYIGLDGVLSSVICTNTGVPQGTVLATLRSQCVMIIMTIYLRLSSRELKALTLEIN